MKTVTIPTFMNPFRCTINNVKYVYPAGTVQTVPDEVAALIADITINAGKRKPAFDFSVDDSKTVGLSFEDGVIIADAIKGIDSCGLFPNGVPAFADATPEQIAWIAKNDDPSKYWSAGDYKVKKIPLINYDDAEVSISGVESPPTCVDVKGLLKAAGITQNGTYDWEYINDGETEPYAVVRDNDGRVLGTIAAGSFENYFDGYAADSFILNISGIKAESDCYLSIAGFNHDDVVNKAAYGKQKAGLTLMCGASRERTGNNKVGVFLPKISGLVDSNGYYKRSNEDTKNYESNTAYRSNLQNVLDYFPEFAAYVQLVAKYTAQYYNHNNRFTQWLVTNDKVFLPSEYELFGEVVLSPNKEGEQYELFKLGESKIIVTPELKEGYKEGSSSVNSRLWLRSASAKYVNPKLPPVSNTYTPLDNLSANTSRVGDDSDYNNSVFMTYNQSTERYNYAPSIAHGNTFPAYILPMFCL